MSAEKSVHGPKASLLTEDCLDSLDQTLITSLADDANPVVRKSLSVTDLGRLLLHYAREGEAVRVRELMARGAPFITDWLGTSAIHFAAKNNHLETCETLLRGGIGKDLRTKVDRTPLHFAAYEGHEDIVRLLVEYKSDVNAKDMLHMTALHWAIEKRFPKIAEFLVQNGAHPTAMSKFDKTPLSIATATKQTELIGILEMAAYMHFDRHDQVQEATANLLQEMSQAEGSGSVQHEIDTTDTGQNGSDDYNHRSMGSLYNMETSSPIAEDLDTVNIDDTTSLSDAILQLQNVDDAKVPNNPTTMQLLKDHGISMLPVDEPTNLISSAIQRGRKIVLTEAGKLMLNDSKLKRNLVPLPPQQINDLPMGQELKVMRQQRAAQISAQNNTKGTSVGNSSNTNKFVKVLTAQEFKQLCGGNVSNALKKITTESIKLTSNSGQSTKKPLMMKTKMTPITNMQHTGAGDKSDVCVIRKTVAGSNFVELKSNSEQSSDETVSPLRGATNPLTKSKGGQLDGVEIERQLMEMRKNIDELRKKLEQSQRQNESYKLRLERLERANEIDRQERLQRMSFTSS